MEVFGVPMNIWHSLVVEEHTGIIIFVIAALVVRVLADLSQSRVKPVSDQLGFIHTASDMITYLGSFTAVLFLIVSGITGYLILPYSTLVAKDVYLNKSLLALGALFFWAAFFFTRYWFGVKLWERKGLYLVQIVTAILGLFFTALAASVGAELTLGQSAMEPLYKALGFNWKTFAVQPLEIEITAVLAVAGIVLVLLLKRSGQKKAM